MRGSTTAIIVVIVLIGLFLVIYALGRDRAEPEEVTSGFDEINYGLPVEPELTEPTVLPPGPFGSTMATPDTSAP